MADEKKGIWAKYLALPKWLKIVIGLVIFGVFYFLLKGLGVMGSKVKAWKEIKANAKAEVLEEKAEKKDIKNQEAQAKADNKQDKLEIKILLARMRQEIKLARKLKPRKVRLAKKKEIRLRYAALIGKLNTPDTAAAMQELNTETSDTE